MNRPGQKSHWNDQKVPSCERSSVSKDHVESEERSAMALNDPENHDEWNRLFKHHHWLTVTVHQLVDPGPLETSALLLELYGYFAGFIKTFKQYKEFAFFDDSSTEPLLATYWEMEKKLSSIPAGSFCRIVGRLRTRSLERGSVMYFCCFQLRL